MGDSVSGANVRKMSVGPFFVFVIVEKQGELNGWRENNAENRPEIQG